jgi:hypothetical protein
MPKSDWLVAASDDRCNTNTWQCIFFYMINRNLGNKIVTFCFSVIQLHSLYIVFSSKRSVMELFLQAYLTFAPALNNFCHNCIIKMNNLWCHIDFCLTIVVWKSLIFTIKSSLGTDYSVFSLKNLFSFYIITTKKSKGSETQLWFFSLCRLFRHSNCINI